MRSDTPTFARLPQEETGPHRAPRAESRGCHRWPRLPGIARAAVHKMPPPSPLHDQAKRVAARRVVPEVQSTAAATRTAAARAGDRQTARRKVPFKTLQERARADGLGMHRRAHLASELRQRLIKENLVCRMRKDDQQ